MPRPTPAQLAYGSATVVFSTLALLLLTRTTHGVGVAAIGVASMLLGLLVAVALPMSRSARQARADSAARPTRGRRDDAAVSAAASADGLTTRVAPARSRAGGEVRVAARSLRR
ncbi:hypothetical protein AB0M39_17125 [Streptomyces sp. NPDC051907]|uniref:hypothetical protein n=1 Tax=Streptomyces sp. NPDC051907 TaxID=3155284 RepID=UPI00343B6E79